MSDPYKRLDEAMRRRRLEIGMKTWRDLALAAGVSYETLRALRNGEGKPADSTVHGIERALQWQPGSVQRVLEDKDPLLSGSLPPASAEMRGTVGTQPDEIDPVAAHFEALLEQVNRRTVERLDELTRKFEESTKRLEESVEESNKRADESQQMLRKLLDERKGA